MIYGIGTDICDVRRIRAVLDRWGEPFAARILGPVELAVWRERSAHHAERGVGYLATRFCAKEAFAKAIGLGMRLPMTWQHCEITHDPSSGKPGVVLHGLLKAWFEARGLCAHVSLSDERDTAIGFVVVEHLNG